jgi:hypothetical protein
MMKEWAGQAGGWSNRVRCRWGMLVGRAGKQDEQGRGQSRVDS